MLDEALTAASEGNYSFAAAKLQDAGFPDHANRMLQAGLNGDRGTKLYLIVADAQMSARATPNDVLGAAPPPVPVSPSGGGTLAPAPAASLIGDIIKVAAPVVGTAIGGPIGGLIGGLAGFGGGSGGGTQATPGISDLPILPGGVLTGPIPGTPTIGQVSDIFGNLFGGGNGAQTPIVNQPNLTFPNLGQVNLAKPAAHAQLQAPAPGFVIAKVKATDPLFTAAVSAGGVAQPDGSVKIAMRKEYARSHGYWKPRGKALLTPGERKTIRKAETLRRKVARTAKAAGVNCTMPRKRR